MNKIATACGVSKANLYHYYKDKDELLFDVIRFHLEELLQVIEAADRPNLAPRHDCGVGTALLEAYRDADAQHSVQISSMRFLSDERQTELKNMERDLVRTFSDAVSAVVPQIKGTTLLKPVTMSLFGMVNWHYLWFKSPGPVTRAAYADLVTRLIVDGTRGLVPQPVPAPKRVAARRK
jgi:TetR/AcrR family transcriptional regulator